MNIQNKLSAQFEIANNQCIQRDQELAILFISIDHFEILKKFHSSEMLGNFLNQVREHLEMYESLQIESAPEMNGKFAVVMSGSAQQVTIMAGLIRRGIESMDSFLNVSVSIGVGHTSQFERNCEKLLKAAEDAVVKANKWGGNRVVSALKSSSAIAA